MKIKLLLFAAIIFASFTTISGQDKITLTTEKSLNSYFDFYLEFASNAWIDWNENGIIDAGEELNPGNQFFELQNQNIILYGDVEYVSFYGCQIKNIDISENPVLEALTIIENQVEITNLNLQSNSLASIQIFDSEVPLLDLSLVPNLANLSLIGVSSLSSIDLSNSSLYYLQLIALPSLSSINLSNANNLKELGLIELSHLSSLDITMLDDLEELSIVDLPSLNSIDISNLNNLTFLELFELPNITNVDVSNMENLESFHIGEMPITSIDLTKNLYLESLGLYDLPLASLDISKNRELNFLGIVDIPVNALDFTNNVNVWELRLEGLDVEVIDLSALGNLSSLFLRDLSIKELDLTNNTLLNRLDLTSLEIETLDLSQNINLEFLYINRSFSGGMPFTSPAVKDKKIYKDVKNIEIINNLKLKSGGLAKTSKLTTLDLSSNVGLRTLYLENMRLDNYDISKNIILSDVTIENCALKSIDISNNTELEYLILSDNELKSLDVSSNSNLKYRLNIENNDFDACALNRIIDDLPLGAYYNYFLSSGNPGALTANTHILTAKGWDVDVAGDGTGCIPDEYVVFTTGKPVGQTVKLKVEFDTEAWVDLNGNGKKDLDEYLYNFVETEFEITSQTLTIYGDVIRLEIESEEITEIDLSNNPKLNTLYCGDNKISSLDLSVNSNLYELSATYNDISSIILPESSYVLDYVLSYNKLTELDLRVNLFGQLYINNNSFSDCELNDLMRHLSNNYESGMELNIRNNPGTATSNTIEYSAFDWELMGVGDGSGCPNSNRISLQTDKEVGEKIKIYLEYDGDASIDINMDGIIELGENIESNELEFDIISPVFTIYGNVKVLHCSDEQLINVDFTHSTTIEEIDISNNEIEVLNLKNIYTLEQLYASNNQLNNIDVEGANNLKALDLENNYLSTIDIDSNEKLTFLSIKNNLFDACSLNDLYISLPENENSNNRIFVEGNPGALTSTTQIAVDNDWEIDVAGDGSGCVGVRIDYKKTANLTIYPNPAKDYLVIENNNTKLIDGQLLQIIDMQGVVHLSERLYNSNSTINISSLSGGIYFVKVGTEINKLIVK